MGTSITITDLDLVTLRRLEHEAKRRGLDVATVARDVLRQAAPGEAPPPAPTPTVEPHRDLDALAGTWSAADARPFDDAVAPFAGIDPELWK